MMKLLLSLFLLLSSGVRLGAATLAAGYQATDWATGFVGLNSPDGGAGPFGIAQSPSNEIYVFNISENALYHFSTSGGVAGASTSASFEPQYGSMKGRTQRPVCQIVRTGFRYTSRGWSGIGAPINQDSSR